MLLEPIGRIDLGACVTDNVTIAPREICSRMNTFMLETSRNARQDDKESLVVQRKGESSGTSVTSFVTFYCQDTSLC